VFAADALAHRCRQRLELAPAWAVVDPSQLKQVLWNLLRNAAEASREGGVVTVATGEADREGMVFVRIEDRGEGISRADLDRIFDPFFTTKATGTGLGLSTVHRIVEGLGGQIEVESVVGEGTRFTVLLPASRPPAEG
ncbi:MAG TPA: ATP-binding protein, partial [Vulgatibacter sp.]